MKNFAKILALVLSVLMLLSVFAGCSNNKIKRAEEPLGENVTKEEKFAEHVTLTWCYVDTGGGTSPGWERIAKAVNEIAEREINASINIEVIPLAEYDSKMSMKYAANERWDIAFCGTQWNPYANAVSQKVLEPLSEDYLKTYMPQTMENLDSRYFSALTVDGQLYGIPLEQIYVRQNGIRFSAEIGNIPTGAVSETDLTALFDNLLENQAKIEFEEPVSREAIRRTLKKTGLDLTAANTGVFQTKQMQNL